MEHKLENDIRFSNEVYESATGKNLNEKEKTSFIDQVFTTESSSEIPLLQSSQIRKKKSGIK